MDWNRHLVYGRGITVAALAAGLTFGVSACSPGASSSSSSTPAATPASGAATTPASTATTAPPATNAAPVSTSTSSGTGNGGTGSVDQNVVLDDCNNVGIVEPSTYTPTCADATYVLNSIHWTTWTAQQASGNATAAVNDCNPNCAAGTTGNYPVYIEFDGQATDPSDPTAQTYMTLTVSYTGSRPPGAGPSQTFKVGNNG
jgi:hypothetical protein